MICSPAGFGAHLKYPIVRVDSSELLVNGRLTLHFGGVSDLQLLLGEPSWLVLATQSRPVTTG